MYFTLSYTLVPKIQITCDSNTQYYNNKKVTNKINSTFIKLRTIPELSDILQTRIEIESFISEA